MLLTFCSAKPICPRDCIYAKSDSRSASDADESDSHKDGGLKWRRADEYCRNQLVDEENLVGIPIVKAKNQ